MMRSCASISAAICGSDLHLYHGMMPDTRIGHTFGHEFVGIDRAGRLVRPEPEGRRQGHGAVQHLLRLVLLLLARAVLQLPQREPECHRSRRHLRVLAHRPAATTGRRPSSCACLSPMSVPPIIPDWHLRRGRPAAHRRLLHRLLRRPARRHRGGRHRQWCSVPDRWASRLPVRVADGGRSGHRLDHLDYRLRRRETSPSRRRQLLQ